AGSPEAVPTVLQIGKASFVVGCGGDAVGALAGNASAPDANAVQEQGRGENEQREEPLLFRQNDQDDQEGEDVAPATGQPPVTVPVPFGLPAPGFLAAAVLAPRAVRPGGWEIVVPRLHHLTLAPERFVRKATGFWRRGSGWAAARSGRRMRLG